jgi:hypothetical protein
MISVTPDNVNVAGMTVDPSAKFTIQNFTKTVPLEIVRKVHAPGRPDD